MAIPAFQAVIFDLDGVITATIEYHYQAWIKALRPLGISMTRAENDRLRSLTRSQSLDQILSGKPPVTDDERQAILKRKNDYYLESVSSMTCADLLPGVETLITNLRQAGLKTGVASASSNTRLVLQRLGISQSIDVVVDANDVPVSKPAPDVYIRTANLLIAPPPTCLALDDSPAGIQAAAQAGMCAVGIGPVATCKESFLCFVDLRNVTVQDLKVVHQNWVATLYAI